MTTLKNNLLILLLLISSTAIYAQDYDLNSYDFRYQKFRGLTFDFDLDSDGGQNFRSTQDTGHLNRDSSYENRLDVNASFSFRTSYFSVINTDKLQRSLNIAGSFSLQGNRGRNNSSFAEFNDWSSSTRGGFSYRSHSRHYKGNNFTYFGLSSNTSLSYRRQASIARYKQVPLNDYKSEGSFTDIANNIDVSYGFGKGRFDNVTDAVQAIFILQDLQVMDSVVYTKNQIEEIAKGITAIRNARYLDFRIRYISQLEQLDSVLRANGVLSEKTTRYFTTISDNWLYGNRLNRVTGTQWTNYATLSSSVSQLDNSFNGGVSNSPINRYNRNNELIPGLSLNTSYGVSKQTSYYLQMSRGVTLSTGLNYISEKSLEESSNLPLNTDSLLQEYKNLGRRNMVIWNTDASASWSFLYQPNTRNYVSGFISPSIQFSRALPRLTNDVDIDWFEYTLNPDLRASASYYHWFSPQLSINVNAFISSTNSFNQRWSTFAFRRVQNTNINYDFSARLVYQFY
jgi:hypothetical protein